mmetsp:Transcript_28740/g.61125  ORF Transcript_28740/g.61125 Transcript_28740/m.61125 type:complete len:220 (-) Transcript_28740:2198-2857(-)
MHAKALAKGARHRSTHFQRPCGISRRDAKAVAAMYWLASALTSPKSKPASGKVVKVLEPKGSPSHVEFDPSAFGLQRATWKMLYAGITAGSMHGKLNLYAPIARAAASVSSSRSLSFLALSTFSQVPLRRGKESPNISMWDARVTICLKFGGTVTTISLITGGSFSGKSASSSKPTLMVLCLLSSLVLQISGSALTVSPCWILLPSTLIAASTTFPSGV